ncbi:hypothetical protein [Runella sp.]|uniref:hypothetical protein n=1 Tax=Runella sp. TaxID=1960881 RepID=UPI003D1005E4
MHEFQLLLPNGQYIILKGKLLVPQEKRPTILYDQGAEIVAVIPDNIPIWKLDAINTQKDTVAKNCNGNCGMNYCDENGCNERKRVLTDLPAPLPIEMDSKTPE